LSEGRRSQLGLRCRDEAKKKIEKKDKTDKPRGVPTNQEEGVLKALAEAEFKRTFDGKKRQSLKRSSKKRKRVQPHGT